MAAPEYVPLVPPATRAYESPPRRPEPWLATRPGEIDGAQPEGPGLGYQGPDQGYALRLARGLADQIVLAPGEHLDDVIAGSVAIATRRSSLFGRAPVIHDVRIALNLFGYLDADAAPELVEHRRPLFAELSSAHHYFGARALASSIPEASLRLTPNDVAARRREWRALAGVA